MKRVERPPQKRTPRVSRINRREGEVPEQPVKQKNDQKKNNEEKERSKPVVPVSDVRRRQQKMNPFMNTAPFGKAGGVATPVLYDTQQKCKRVGIGEWAS